MSGLWALNGNPWAFGPSMRQAQHTSKVLGVHLAIVIDNKDGEGNPGYRVKVKLPALSEQETTAWARIAVPMGGSGRGTYVLPEIEDQVLVVFEHGEISRPIVVGALWSKKQEPVEVNQSGQNNTKLIKSRCGHRIIFDDKQGAEKIIIVDKTKKNKIVLDAVNKVVKVESDGDIEVTAKANVILHSNALKIGASQGVTGKGASLLTHSAKTFGLKATSGITIGGGTTVINVSNAAATSVSGSGSGELGGAGAEAPKAQIEEKPVRGGGAQAGPSSAGAGAATAPRQANAGGAAAPNEQPRAPLPEDEHQIEIEVVDARGKPRANVAYEIVLPDGTTRSGTTGADGWIRISGLRQAGEAKVSFPAVDTALARRRE